MRVSSNKVSCNFVYLAFVTISGQHGGSMQSALAFSPRPHRAKIPLKRVVGYDFDNSYRCPGQTILQKSRRQRTTELYSTFPVPQTSVYLSLLAIQFGCQPILTKTLVPKSIVRSTVLLAQDSSRFLLCAFMLLITGDFAESISQWTFRSALWGAGIPSILYLIQNYCSLIAYQNLPPVTFNILNQTKTLSAALCCYLVMGKRQSPLQVMSLLILLFSALVLEGLVPLGIGRKAKNEESTEIQDGKDVSENDRADLVSGVIPILVASFISGLAGALTQKTLQGTTTSPYLFSMELSLFSILILLTTLFTGNPDGKRLRENKMISVGWTWKTWIPVVTNATGGLLVGLVTKHAGAVKKGFALIFGLVLSGVLQTQFSDGDDTISLQQIAGGILASLSLWMHSAFPP